MLDTLKEVNKRTAEKECPTHLQAGNKTKKEGIKIESKEAVRKGGYVARGKTHNLFLRGRGNQTRGNQPENQVVVSSRSEQKKTAVW